MNLTINSIHWLPLIALFIGFGAWWTDKQTHVSKRGDPDIIIAMVVVIFVLYAQTALSLKY